MYVIFPAEELVRITLGEKKENHIWCREDIVSCEPTNNPPTNNTPSVVQQSLNQQSSFYPPHPPKPQLLQRQPSVRSNKVMSAPELCFRDLSHPIINETLKTHNSVTFKVVRIVSDFTQQLSQIHEQHAEDLQMLVETFRKRNAELRKERLPCPSSLFQIWETLLQEVEVDSQAHSDIASSLGKQVARSLLERTFFRKIQSRKVFTHRESYETILSKTEGMLAKCRLEYNESYQRELQSPTNSNLGQYYETHNAYVQQLHAANAMLGEYHGETLPQLMQELEEVYTDLCSTASDAVLQGAEIISSRSHEEGRRYEALVALTKGVTGVQDLQQFVRILGVPPPTTPRHQYRTPTIKAPPPPEDGTEGGTSNAFPTTILDQSQVPLLKNEILIEGLSGVSVRSRYDSLKKEASELDLQIHNLQDALDTLLRMQQRSLESSLFNKANELQEDISLKRFDLRVAQIHLSAVKAQRELFAAKLEGSSTDNSSRERKMSSSSTGSMKSKWLKAFKSLKTTSNSGNAQKETPTQDKRNGKDKDALSSMPEVLHIFQEYTYKKITPCDVCSQILRGHTRQGLKCRLCKMNVHAECHEKVTVRCQPKSRLLRRQRSTSEIETRLPETEQESSNSSMLRGIFAKRKSISAEDAMPHGYSLDVTGEDDHATASSMVQSTSLMTNIRSFSLPEGATPGTSSNDAVAAPSSPVHNRRLLSARGMRMSSVELPDDNDKSLSSASASPCPSPPGSSSGPKRLLPTNLYVVLYNFKSRQTDELDLKAGYKVTVNDTSDPDWWQGKCLGKIGYFPSKYVTKLHAGEKPLQVTHNLQLSDGDNGLKLLRDQIVIQVGEDMEGMVMIRSGDNKQGVCPLKYLQEV